MSKTDYKIAAFGCWNLVKEDGQNNMTSVLTNLKDNASKYDRIIILGDNYYPLTEQTGNTKIKKFNLQNIKLGFDLINSINIINKDIIMGNHDVELTLLDDVMKCNAMEYMATQRDNMNIRFPFSYEDIILENGKYKLVFIDTNLYAEKVTCINDFEETKIKQNLFINEQINDMSINYIICGHEPLFSLKTTKKKTSKPIDHTNMAGYCTHQTSDKFNNCDKINELIDIVFEKIIAGYNITYLCADIHMYQHCVITKAGKSIVQIVSGTGGGNPDICDLCKNKSADEDITYVYGDYSLELIDNKDSYGYVELILNNNSINHNYKQIINSKQIGGTIKSSKKIIKYKIDYN